MDEPLFFDRLGTLGLTTYEARAYLALLRRDSSTAMEVARLAELPRQRIYDVLATLVGKGLASSRPGNPMKYGATAPQVGLERLVRQRREQLAALESEAATMIEQLTPAYEEGLRFTDPLEYIEVLRDPGAIVERFNELQTGVQREILVFTKPPFATPPQENREGLRLLERQHARAVYEFSLFEDPEHVEGVCRFIEAGAEARFVPELPLKLVIIDEEIVMFGMVDPHGGEADLTIVVVEHPSLAGVLRLAFTSVWESGLTLEEARERVAGTGGSR